MQSTSSSRPSLCLLNPHISPGVYRMAGLNPIGPLTQLGQTLSSLDWKPTLMASSHCSGVSGGNGGPWAHSPECLTRAVWNSKAKQVEKCPFSLALPPGKAWREWEGVTWGDMSSLSITLERLRGGLKQ